jgi:hypothetical protein
MQSAPHGYPFVPHPLALLAAALIAGLLAAHFVSLPLMPLLGGGAAMSAFAVVAVYERRMAWASLFTLLATFVAG